MSALEGLRAEIESIGGTALAVSADVADADAVFHAAERIEQECGPIDFWVNDAMLTVFSPVATITPGEYRRVTEVTYLGFVHGTMAALRSMRPRNKGVIIQIGSALAYRGIPLQSAYCGAKHAIRGFTDSLRSELIYEKSNIRLTIVELPAVNTPQFDWARTHMDKQPRPMPPVYQPEAIAEKVLVVARRPVREYWLGGSTLATILGNVLVPAFFDRLLARRAIEGQQRDLPVSTAREDNLYEPVRALHKQRGSFGGEASTRLIAVPGPIARGMAVGCALAAVLSAGYLLGSFAGSGRKRLPAGIRLTVRQR
ncbi:SDR family oxidoreductase [Bradyrhizobium icense]|uniref:SDR family oxidoreductase n=1 Tax=Bradyrhizobium icense TaxID=1274631 RepID=UPI0026B52C9B